MYIAEIQWEKWG